MVTTAPPRLDRRLPEAFAAVLDYPRGPLGESVRGCGALATGLSPDAARLLESFAAYATDRSVGELQEVYTSAFDLDTLSDLNPTCYPYVGHHLFDENHKRSAFLVGLNERYRAHGFDAGSDLPDHLVVLLRFVAACEDDGLVGELVLEAIIPALERMAGKNDSPAEPASGRERYQQVLRALLLTLTAHTTQAHPAPEPRALLARAGAPLRPGPAGGPRSEEASVDA